MDRLVDLGFDVLVPLDQVLVLSNSEGPCLQLPVFLNQPLQMLPPFLTLYLPLLQLS